MFPVSATTVPPSLVDGLSWLLLNSPYAQIPPDVNRRLRALALDLRRHGFPPESYATFAEVANDVVAASAHDRVRREEIAAATQVVRAAADIMAAEASAADLAGIPAATAARVTSVDTRGTGGRFHVLRLEAGMALSYRPGQFVPVMRAGAQGEWTNLAPALPANPFGQLELHLDGGAAPEVGSWVTLGAARGPVYRPTPGGSTLIVAADTGAAVAKALVFGLAEAGPELSVRPAVHLVLLADTRRDHYDYPAFTALAEATSWLRVTRAHLGTVQQQGLRAALGEELTRASEVVVSGASSSVAALNAPRGATVIAPDAPLHWG